MSSKTDFMVKLLLVFFISLLSFSIGTFVGKKYSDNQHELAALEPSKKAHGENEEATTKEEKEGESSREVASVEGDKEATKEKSHGTMSDEEIAKLAEEFVADEKESPAKDGEHKKESAKEEKTAEAKEEHGKSTSTKEAPRATAHEAKDEPSEAAHQLSGGEKKSAASTSKSTERIPSSLPKNVAQYTVGKFTVQVAAYADEGEAKKFASDLKEKGFSAFYIPANIKGKTWYRVSVGQFATQKEAQSYRAEVLKQANVPSAMVQKITE